MDKIVKISRLIPIWVYEEKYYGSYRKFISQSKIQKSGTGLILKGEIYFQEDINVNPLITKKLNNDLILLRNNILKLESKSNSHVVKRCIDLIKTWDRKTSKKISTQNNYSIEVKGERINQTDTFSSEEEAEAQRFVRA